MVHEKDYDEHSPGDEQTESEPEENGTDPSSDEQDEQESYPEDESKSDTNNDSQPGGKGDSEKFGSDLPKRGSRFRKKLLGKITPITYSNKLDSKEMALETWIGTILKLKAADYLEFLQSIVSKKSM